MNYDLGCLYSLLPEIYRVRDQEQGGQIKALLSVIAEQVAVLEEDLEQLYDDQFIETCAEWVVPYIGDLIGFRGQKMPPGVTVSQKAQVANCLSFRRKKGTFSHIKQIVKDTAGWDCEVVECFRILAMTQNMRYLSQKNASMIDMRPWQDLLDVNVPLSRIGARDKIPHSLDIRSINCNKVLYNINNIGIFVWRLEAKRLNDSPAFKVDDQRYTFSPLGNDIQLFRLPEVFLPVPLTRSTLLSSLKNIRDALLPGTDVSLTRLTLLSNLENCWADLSDLTKPTLICILKNCWADLGGADLSDLSRSTLFSILKNLYSLADLSIMVNGKEIFPQGFVDQAQLTVVACDLSDAQSGSDISPAWLNTPVPEGTVAVDPVLGRIAFPTSIKPMSLSTTFCYGFSADMGGGEYFKKEIPEGIYVSKINGHQSVSDQDRLSNAIQNLGSNGGVVVIQDNERYKIGSLAIDASGGKRIEIRADDGYRPVIDLQEEMTIDGYKGEVSLSGLIIYGSAIRAGTGLKSLKISHCTLVPGLRLGREITELPSLQVFNDGSGSGIEVEISKSIVGPLRLPADGADLIITDSIVDSPTRGRGARIFPALASGKNLLLAGVAVPNLLRMSFEIIIAGYGPCKVSLPRLPKDLKEAREMLEKAIRSACDSPGFMGARVMVLDGTLAIVPGIPGEVSIISSGRDLASWLKLDPEQAKRTVALVGGVVSIPIKLSSNDPTLTISLDGQDRYHLKIRSCSSLKEIAEELQSSVSAHRQLEGLLVGYHEDELIILSSNEELVPSFGPSKANGSFGDHATYRELGLQSDAPAISDSDDFSGPELTIERSTVLGMVKTRKLSLASECIFADLLLVDQRQVGCLRFSYIRRGSKTPQMHGCIEEDWPEVLRFTSTAYGNPGYCQLSQLCSAKIRQGIDGGELGAFHDLYQPQREANMIMSLRDHMRFCLDYGIFYCT